MIELLIDTAVWQLAADTLRLCMTDTVGEQHCWVLTQEELARLLQGVKQ